MNFQEKVNQKREEIKASLDSTTYDNTFEDGIRISKEILKPSIDKIIEAFEEIKKYVAVESQVGQKLKAAIKEYKELQL